MKIYGKLVKMAKDLTGNKIGKIKPFKELHKFVSSKVKSRTAEVMGHKMLLDENDDLSLSINEVFEPVETDIVIKQVKLGQTVVDIGANIGYYTLIMARLVGPEGRVIAFEPDPNNFDILKKNIEMNGYKNVTLYQKAVSQESGNIQLYFNRHGSISRTFDAGDGREKMEVGAVKLDDVVKERVDFIKIDIEGAEIGAIKGSKEILSKWKPTIISEFAPKDIKKFGATAEEYLRIMQELKYNFYDADEETRNLQKVDIETLLSKYPEDGILHTNILFN